MDVTQSIHLCLWLDEKGRIKSRGVISTPSNDDHDDISRKWGERAFKVEEEEGTKPQQLVASLQTHLRMGWQRNADHSILEGSFYRRMG